MTVAELIAKLQGMPDDAIVATRFTGRIEHAPLRTVELTATRDHAGELLPDYSPGAHTVFVALLKFTG